LRKDLFVLRINFLTFENQKTQQSFLTNKMSLSDFLFFPFSHFPINFKSNPGIQDPKPYKDQKFLILDGSKSYSPSNRGRIIPNIAKPQQEVAKYYVKTSQKTKNR